MIKISTIINLDTTSSEIQHTCGLDKYLNFWRWLRRFWTSCGSNSRSFTALLCYFPLRVSILFIGLVWHFGELTGCYNVDGTIYECPVSMTGNMLSLVAFQYAVYMSYHRLWHISTLVETKIALAQSTPSSQVQALQRRGLWMKHCPCSVSRVQETYYTERLMRTITSISMTSSLAVSHVG